MAGNKRNARTRVVPKLLVVVAMIASSLFTTSAVQAQDTPDLDISGLVSDEARARFAQFHESLGITSPVDSLRGRAINPDDFECSSTPFGDYAESVFSGVDEDLLDFLFGNFVDFWAGDQVILFDNDPSDTYVGTNGEYTREQMKRHRKADGFWDAPTSDVQLHGMHGADLADDAKMVPFLAFAFGIPTEDAQEFLDFVQEVIEATIGYDHPLFTFNAFAIPGQEVPGFGSFPDKIVMGDGILDAIEAIGFATNGPDLIHAHEFAHHVQFEIGAFDTDILDQAEATRRTELMADAFAAYNLAHARGASFQTKRIVEIVSTSFSAGDCNFDDSNHHGTPNQRAAAAEWGASLAQTAKPRSKVLSSYELLALFDAELPRLVAPDAR